MRASWVRLVAAPQAGPFTLELSFCKDSAVLYYLDANPAGVI